MDPLTFSRRHGRPLPRVAKVWYHIIMLMIRNFEKIVSLLKMNMTKTQLKQKHWYDKSARERTFEAGEQVLILLPTSTSRLLAQWQGPYLVVKAVCKVN